MRTDRLPAVAAAFALRAARDGRSAATSGQRGGAPARAR
jgi:hypothetical protein